MDPDKAYEELCDLFAALQKADRRSNFIVIFDYIRDRAEDLADWLDHGGFPPKSMQIID